ncbi:GNAT family N-acetyltransferase [Flavivirga algicola]|uniref:GNAT family N-acetyltransferase n=1 Tax=Flavivirga algicola TaxID=2729136 RepID=A0ABX1S2R3_9FLAO|nr:GNAT family N-acetyltransferase [Flavivirga algicola]NMH89540.1 GNAT family N-acetyltransferase [Flavivirga algicola]
MIENESIQLLETKAQDLPQIIEIEKKYVQFVGQYNLAQHKKVTTNQNEKHLSVFNKSDNALIGYVILAGILNKNRVIEFRRIALLKRGLGYGKPIVKLIKEICFKQYKANKVWLDVYTDNERAIRLYVKEGFVKEKRVKQPNKNGRSVYMMSITK